MRRSKASAQAAAAYMLAFVKQQPENIRAATEKRLEAEKVIDEYIDAVQARKADLPNRQDLADACLYLLKIYETDHNDHMLKFVQELLMPEVGISMYGILPEVRQLKDEIMGQLEKLSTNKIRVESEKYQPSNDLF